MINIYNAKYDYEKPNFVTIYSELLNNGVNVENASFPLLIFDEGLLHHGELDMQLKIRILRECLNNFWYFFREIYVRMVGISVDKDDIKMLYAAIFNIDCLRLYKSFDEYTHIRNILRGYYLWLYVYGNTNNSICIIDKSFANANDYVDSIVGKIQSLPPYLQACTIAKNKKNHLYRNKTNNNELVYKSYYANNEEQTRNIAMSLKYPNVLFNALDECKYSTDLYRYSILPIHEAKYNAVRTNKTSSAIYTANYDHRTEAVNYITDFGMEFSDDIFNMRLEDLKDSLRAGGTSTLVINK